MDLRAGAAMNHYRVQRELLWVLRWSLLFTWCCAAGGALLLGWVLGYLAGYPGALELLYWFLAG